MSKEQQPEEAPVMLPCVERIDVLDVAKELKQNISAFGDTKGKAKEKAAFYLVSQHEQILYWQQQVRELHARVLELEEDLQLARQGIGAEAYDMACEEMEAYQLKRAKAGKEAGTTLSLVDGMAWVYERLDELEAQVQRAAEVERAAILERVKNRAVAGALLVEDFRSIVADRGPAAPGQRAPLTDAQLDVLALDGEGLPNSHLEFARAVERAHGITQEKQG